MLENFIRNERKNLYLHLKPFNTNFKSNSYLLSLFCRCPINPSTPFFQISILQKPLQVYLLFQISMKNGCNNFFFHLYTFDERYKSVSYLTSLSRRGPVTATTHTFPNINVTKTIANLPIVWQITEKGLQWSLFPLFYL